MDLPLKMRIPLPLKMRIPSPRERGYLSLKMRRLNVIINIIIKLIPPIVPQRGTSRHVGMMVNISASSPLM